LQLFKLTGRIDAFFDKIRVVHWVWTPFSFVHVNLPQVGSLAQQLFIEKGLVK
jgi:hypothetical protein